MKQIFFCLITLLVLSCKNQKSSEDLLKIVSDQSDGWNTFSITLRKDGSYIREDFGSTIAGKYNFSGNIIFLANEKIVYEKTPYGCIFNIRYISKNNSTNMRVTLDNIFCNPITTDKLSGVWEIKNLTFGTDTLKLWENETAEFQKKLYSAWQVDYSTLLLSDNSISTPWFIMNIKHDTVWLIPPYSTSINSAHVLKGIRLKK